MISGEKGSSRIIGVQLMELSLTLLNENDAKILAKYALLRDDGLKVGKYEKGLFGDKVIEAVGALIRALEEDGALEIFEGLPTGTDESVGSTPQV